MLLVEIIILCSLFFIICFLGTGTDEKNLKNFSSYPDRVQKKLEDIEEYRGRYKESKKICVFIENLFIFSILFLVLGKLLKEEKFINNFISLFILGQTLNVFDLLIIDLLWWRNTKRIRFSKIPQKNLYQDPKKHVESFIRAFVMYSIVALIDGYILTII